MQNETLWRTYVAAFPDGWSHDSFINIVNRDNTHIYCAENILIEGAAIPAAILLVSVVVDEAEILTLATHPNLQRKGYAQSILREMIADLQQTNIRSIFLEVSENNTAAISLYNKLGFKEISRRHNYYKTPDGFQNAIVMTLISN
jgi:ribosomal-protein-alanine N-acetyltransferase